MSGPLVSVLMPVFNGQRYLEIALASVLDQTFREFELIVVDDGSTDDTPHILARCRDPRLKLFRREHAGLIGALNAGVEHCSAPYIARMDADDLSYPDRLARQVEFLATHEDVALVSCWSDLLDETGQVIGRRTEGIGDDMLLELAAGNRIVHGSIMIRRESLPLPPAYREAPEDYRLWADLARTGRRFHCIPAVLYGFRTHRERYSVVHARSQSAGIVDVQWPLLEECTRSRPLQDPSVRSLLVRGWGTVAGAAYCSGDHKRGDTARQRFMELAGTDWSGAVEPAVHHGIEAMIWGGCPWRAACGLRWSQWKRKPTAWSSVRNFVLSLPGMQRLRAVIRGP